MIVAGVLAVVLVAGGAAAVVLTNNNNSKESSDIGVALPVYGNADLDSDIDDDDLDIINKIIDEEEGYTLSAYPFADANKDKTVNSDDATVVQNIIDGKATKVYHFNYHNDSGTSMTVVTVDTAWPCKDLMVTYNSLMFMLTSLGVDDRVVGATAVGTTNMDKYMYAKILEGAAQLEYSYDSSWNSFLDVSSVSSIMSGNTDAHTVFVSGYTNYDTYNESEIEAVGCDVVRLCESNPCRDETLASVLLAGFLTQTLDRAKELVEMYKEIWDACDKIASTLSDDDKKGYLVALNGNTVNGYTNQHNYKCRLAGGSSVLTESTSPDSGTWMLEDDVNGETDTIIFVMWSNAENGFFFGDHELNVDYFMESIWGTEEETTVWEQMDAWESGDVYIVYGDFPTAFDILLRGYAMYPQYYGDLYEESLDKLLSFISGGDFADKDLQFVYTLEEFKNYNSTE